jgi:hypothetical protein|tara:strand:- start:1036 stop:1347 length:312 start_codon:yes stop_codon:yes gene_type:complete
MELWQQFFSSSTANIAFGALVVVILWVKRRIKVSRCKTNCHWFECESQLDNLMKVSDDVQTQRGMIQEIQQMMVDLNAIKPPSIQIPKLLRTPTPKRARATSV